MEAIRNFLGKTYPTKTSLECATCSVDAGTVTPHNHHVLLRVHPEADNSGGKFWWPESVDMMPIIQQVNKAMRENSATIEGKVKVTLWEPHHPSPSTKVPSKGTADILIFPACASYTGIPLELINAAILHDVTKSDAAKPELDPAVVNSRQVHSEFLTLIVCCHQARDSRCGSYGPPLASKLAETLDETSLKGATVIASSHVGGHKYAGNVLVYGPSHPAHGHWFGGLCDKLAKKFIDSLAELDGSKDPAAHKFLRRYWRGQIGMQKDAQLKHFESVEDIEELGEQLA